MSRLANGSFAVVAGTMLLSVAAPLSAQQTGFQQGPVAPLSQGFQQTQPAPATQPVIMPAIVPMPPLPPLPKDGVVASLSSAPKAVTPAAPAAPQQPTTVARVDPAVPGALTAAQRQAVERVNTYFNSVTTLVGNFVQVGPDRSRLEGDFYLQKPGKMRFDYDAPSPVELISDGSSVVVRDRKLATQDLYPLSQTPLRFLLAEKLDLLKDTKVIGVHQDDLFINVTIEEKHPLVGTHKLMLMFGAKDTELKQWTITDPQGYDTTIAIFNVDAKKRPDPSLFKIDYTLRRD
ncbi:MAG TPA: outer membrane lipoprotein carrier protein LolA [Xanthobacteraceae bacterium]|nr:outer membrane lipoprotein carrier protein LolA [Xanthobacteraceae bacterium]